MFRDETIKNLEKTWSGEVILMRPLSFSFYVFISIAILTIILLFISWASYTKREIGIGFIRPELGITTIVPAVSGKINKINVEEGQYVEQGDLLFSVEMDLQNKDGSLSEQQMAEIIKQIEYIESGLKNTKKLYSQKKVQIDSKIHELNDQLVSAQKKMSFLEDKLNILKEEKNSIESMMSKGLISRVEYNSRNKIFLDAQIGFIEIKETISLISGEITQLSNSKKQLTYEFTRERNNARISVSQLNQKIFDVNYSRSFFIRAPISGTISTVLVTPSNYVNSNTNVMAIVPQKNRWIAELFVPTEAIGNVSESNPVYIKYEAYPYQRFGVYEGNIKVISKTILNVDNLPRELNSLRPMYRILIDLKEQEVTLNQKKYSLQSGMMLSAELDGETRTIFQWFMGPLFDLKRGFQN